jgi:hypothetical protein
MADYRIEFTVHRREDGEEDFTEIGFGSSGACGDVDAAAYEAQTILQRREWETDANMPAPEDA